MFGSVGADDWGFTGKGVSRERDIAVLYLGPI